MVKIQLDLNEAEDRKVTLFKVDKGFETKAEAIKEMIKLFPLKPVSVGNFITCKKCGELVDEFEADDGLCKKCKSKNK